MAGIHPGPKGAFSIALSGGYDDNIDLGECFTYTGEGTEQPAAEMMEDLYIVSQPTNF